MPNQLSLPERIIIERMLHQDYTFASIGRALDRSASTIAREVLHYRCLQAEFPFLEKMTVFTGLPVKRILFAQKKGFTVVMLPVVNVVRKTSSALPYATATSPFNATCWINRLMSVVIVKYRKNADAIKLTILRIKQMLPTKRLFTMPTPVSEKLLLSFVK